MFEEVKITFFQHHYNRAVYNLYLLCLKFAADGIEARLLIEKEPIDLLITNIIMPRMKGTQLLRWCRSNDFTFPVFLISGNHCLSPSERKQAYDENLIFLHKPFELKHLLSSITTSFNLPGLT